MRDLALILLIFGALPFAFGRPAIGIFLWVWVSVMNPHRLTWNYAADFPFAQAIAIVTLIGILLSRKERKFPWTPVTVVMVLLILWMNVNMIFALDHEAAFPMWDRVMKIFLMTFVALYVLRTKQDVQVLIWVITLSVAFFGIKGGLFTIREGGEFRVYGPPGSFIEENNSLALATIMTIPLLWYLYLQATKGWLRLGLLGAMVLCSLSALGSHSRGAFLAIGAMLGSLWLKSRRKLITGFVLILLVPFAIAFMPEKWEERMRSIQHYEQDSSAMGRINAWNMAVNLATDRAPLGGGFEIYNRSVFGRYAPVPDDVHSAHSIYFQMLGEHGYIGLALFLLLWWLVWRDARRIVKQARGRNEWQWASDLARMIQVSLVGYAVGGAFLNLAYYDVPYYLLVAIVLTRVMLKKALRELDQREEVTVPTSDSSMKPVAPKSPLA